MNTEIFHHQAGGFPLGSAAYRVDGEAVHVNVAIADTLHHCTLQDRDAQRFADAVTAAGLHYQWPGGALPRLATMYEVDVDQDGYPWRVTWWWAGQDGKFTGAEARGFLRSAGVLKICDSCDEERLTPPELRVCDRCGYLASDGWSGIAALLKGEAL